VLVARCLDGDGALRAGYNIVDGDGWNEHRLAGFILDKTSSISSQRNISTWRRALLDGGNFVWPLLQASTQSTGQRQRRLLHQLRRF